MATESQARGGSSREEKPSTALKRAAGPKADSDDDSDGEDVRSRVQGAVDDVTSALDLKGRLERHPYGTLAAAVGIGYVLGGGFFTPLTGRLVRLGLKLGVRLAVLPLINDEVATVVSEAISGEGSDNGGTKRRRSRNT